MQYGRNMCGGLVGEMRGHHGRKKKNQVVTKGGFVVRKWEPNVIKSSYGKAPFYIKCR